MNRHFEVRRQRDRQAILAALRRVGGEAKMGELCRLTLLNSRRIRQIIVEMVAENLVETAGNFPHVIYKLKQIEATPAGAGEPAGTRR